MAWPADNDAAIAERFGPRGDESRLVLLPTPCPMRLAWDPLVEVRRIRCHALVAPSLGAILAEIFEHFNGDLAAFRASGLDLFGGCFNVRRMRGSRSWSRHSWGIAIDLDPSRNTLDMVWPHAAPDVRERAEARWRRMRPGSPVQYAAMPPWVVEAFERHGWKSGGRAWGIDGMHFQATQ